MRMLAIFNDRAGSATRFGEAREALSHWSGTHFHHLAPDERTADVAERAALDGTDLIVAVGGDGTVNQVVNGLMRVDKARRPVLGVVPLGTGNDLARTLAIPLDPAAAVEALRSGAARTLDLIRAAGDFGEM